jgi:hypothetical protein
VELGDPGNDGESKSRPPGLARVEREKDLFSGSGIDPLSPVTDSQPRLAFGRAALEEKSFRLSASACGRGFDGVAQQVHQGSPQQDGGAGHLRKLAAPCE